MKFINQLPNALTLTNLTLGTMAIFAMINNNVPLALLLMGGSLIADALDGALARKLGVASGIGVQLDSLADLVSFGVLPGVMIYFLGTKNEGFPSHFIIGIFAALTTASAGLRLARFNVDTKPREYFWGLATPAGGILVAGWLWADFIDHNDGFGFSEFPLLTVFISLFLIIFYHVPLKLPSFKSPRTGLVTATLVVILVGIGIFTLGPISIPLGVLIYVGLGLLNLVLKWY